MVFVLEAGAAINPDAFAPKAIELSSSADVDTEVRAISALGGMDLRAKAALQTDVRAVLSNKAADHARDRIVAMALASLAEIAAREDDAGPLIDAVRQLAPPLGVETQLVLAQTTWRTAKVSAPELRPLLLETLRGFDRTNPNIVSQLDLGLMDMVTDDSFDAAAAFLAQVIDASDGKLQLSAFELVHAQA